MLRAMSVTELEPGQSLRLEVIDNGPPPQLRVMPPPLDDHQDVIGQALRRFLPRQEGLQGVMERLTRFAAQHSDASDTHPLPPALRDALRNVLGAMPDKGALSTPEGLKQAIQNSGLFLEAKLAQQAQTPAAPASAAPSLGQDMKARLLKLADNLSARLSTLEEGAPQQESAADAVVVFPRPSLASPPNPGASAPQARLANMAPEALPTPLPAETAVLPDEVPLQPPPSPGGPASPETETVAGGQNAAASPAMAEKADDATPGAPAHPHAAARSAAPESAAVIPAAARESELKDLLNKTESALAKIVLDQLASARQPDSTAQSWRLDLPFQNQGRAETASLKISREGGRQGGEADANQSWAVTLELKPPGLGTLHSRLTLYRGEVSGVFWSDAPATAELVRQHLDILDFRLRAAGLKTGQLDAAVGTPPETDSAQVQPRLLDERA